MAQTNEEIVNPRTGQRMIFRQTAADTNGVLLQIETVNPPGPAEPEHIHPEQVSSAEVLAGTLSFNVAGTVRRMTPGEKIVIPAGTHHFFWNDGEEDARAMQELRPALRIEDFFTSWFALARDGKLDAKGMPPFLQTVALVPAFGREIRPTSPPWPLLRAIAWLLGSLARARGYGSVYPPVTRPVAHGGSESAPARR